MPTLLDEPLDPTRAYFITQRMTKQMRKYPITKPFHAKRTCKHNGCVWHKKGDK